MATSAIRQLPFGLRERHLSNQIEIVKLPKFRHRILDAAEAGFPGAQRTCPPGERTRGTTLRSRLSEPHRI
jgi:hypothetical protein